ncbi:MAG: peptidylprolyl isomerase [Elusimicrobia bacterium]|nr:peptidylprolyl isomerase [Elusimicrobiota bacterium]
MRLFVLGPLALALLVGCSHAPKKTDGSGGSPAVGSSVPATAKKDPYAVLVTNRGTITIRLFPESAPRSVENFIGLATGTKGWTDPATGAQMQRPLYKGSRVFRVLPGFLIQGGSPTDALSGDAGVRVDDEFSKERRFAKAGAVAYAGAGAGSNSSQFFITLVPAPWLNEKHTVFGEVVDGLDIVDRISRVPRSDKDDAPLSPVVLQDVRIESR